MTNQIFINIPVKDLKKSITFFTHMGFRFNPQFTDEKAACMIVSENIFVMLLTESFFKTFINTDVCDTRKNTEMILSVATETKEEVDKLTRLAVEAGGVSKEPPRDYGWMYQKNFLDPDGHRWEIFYMDLQAMPASTAQH